MHQNDTKATGVIVGTVIFLLIIVSVIFFPQHKPKQKVTIKPTVETIHQEETIVLTEPIIEQSITSEPPSVIPFNRAFAIARSALGPGESFTWNGNEYSTNTAEENLQPVHDGEPSIELAEAQDSVILSHTLTP